MRISLTMLAAIMAATSPVTAFAAADEIIYRFTAPPNGVRPQGALVADAQGNLYGTTYTGSRLGYGAVYMLSPNPHGHKIWHETVLFRFDKKSQGQYPQSALIFDARGNLYGMTPAGGPKGAGVVFELSPPSSGSGEWSETILHDFGGKNDGAQPYGGLVFGPDGSLYGTTSFGGVNFSGTVFKLAPNTQSGGWDASVIFNFANGVDGGYPYCTVAFDASGGLYGTTLNGGNTGNGVVFQLTPPTTGTLWNEAVLHSFDTASDGVMPREGVTLDPAGNVFGTTEVGGANDWGVAYEVSPPAGGSGAWTEQVIHTFNANKGGGGPTYTTLLRAQSGVLYGTSSHPGEGTSNGTVFSLTPPGSGTSWTLKDLHRFHGGTDGLTPEAGLILTADGKLTGTTFFGGNSAQEGVVFKIKP